MKVFLMHKDQDFDLQRQLPSNEQELTQDLELNTLFNTMALGDKYLFEVAKKAVLCGLTDLYTIRYRQSILEDCLNNPSVVRDIYQIPIESIENQRRHWMGLFAHSPSGVLSGAREMMQMFAGLLKRLKTITDEHAEKFQSEGFTAFFAMIKKELDDEYFDSMENHLKALKFREGVLVSAELGRGNEGANYILRKLPDKKRSWIKGIFAKKPPTFTFNIHPRDEAGFTALSQLRNQGINLVANALAQSSDHINSFLNMLRTELAFYVGCLNLHGQLAQIGEPVCFPMPVASRERRHCFKGLYDVCLAMTMKQKIVGNDVDADNRDLVIISGANQGGKSTFLRSIGLAQLMTQCGMFAPADSFCSNVCEGLFTHYKRQEDATMNSGKLDEELSRMSDIADNITANCMALFNESFAATNEREGSEIASQIVRALLEKRIKVFFVTHQYEFAHGFYDQKMENAIFLRAERQADGARTFKLIEGEPLQTSYGEDLYNRIFGTVN
ncbi:MAG: DNA mismatch repair protein MutS [Deltaproteobacteria bacterium]|nr:DNA mismatch repair protein MutS [Deltaproteobacteria bacterium]